MRFLTHCKRRRPAGIHDDDGPRALEPLVAGMGCIGERRPTRVVVRQDGGEQIGPRGPHPVEQREIAIAVAEEAQHRHHAIDRIEQRRRRRNVARGECRAQRQKIDEELDEGAGIAADVPAVREDLPQQFVAESSARRRTWRCCPAMQRRHRSARSRLAGAARRRGPRPRCGANGGPAGSGCA